jgi:preprotein translocase subunit YajC
VKSLAGFLPFVLIALVFWFLIVRPQRRRQQELSSTQSALGVGTEVMLGSGIYGTVVSVEDDTIHLELAPGTTVKVARQAVVRILDAKNDAPGTADDTPAPPTDDPDEGPADSGERHP